MTQTDAQRRVSMRRYGLQLVALMLGLGVAATAASQLLSFELPSAMGMIILIASMILPANRFAAAERRQMTAGERAQLGLWAAAGTLVVGAAIVIGVLLWAGMPLTAENATLAMFGGAGITPRAAMAIFAGSAIITFLIAFLCAGFMTRGQLKALEKQDARSKS